MDEMRWDGMGWDEMGCCFLSHTSLGLRAPYTAAISLLHDASEYS